MLKPLHICFISQEYPPDTGWGGIGSYTYEMAHGLVQIGQRVTVICRALDTEEVVDDQGVQVHRILPSPDWNRMRGFWRLNSVWPGFAWAAMLRLRSIRAVSRVDVVEASEVRADSFFIPLLRKRPIVVTRLHTAWIFVDRLNRVQPDWKKKLIYWQEKHVITNADCITSPSEAMIRLTNNWAPVKARKPYVIPNPVSTRMFVDGRGARTGEVLFVGRFERNKGANVLAASLPIILRSCPDTSFRFVGADGVDEEGRSWRDRLRENVPEPQRHLLHFEQVSRSEVAIRYQQAAVCVIPSLWENFPYVLLEAMACGTPVVATRVGGIPEMVRDGETGILVAPNNPSALAEAVVSLLRDPSKREAMGRRARQSIESTFDTNVIVPQMLTIYLDVLRNN